MANTKQAKKRIRIAEKNRQHNAGLRSAMRTYIKKVITAIESGNQEKANEFLKAATPFIDKMAQKGIIHKNKAARQKSRLAIRIKKMSQNASATSA